MVSLPVSYQCLNPSNVISACQSGTMIWNHISDRMTQDAVETKTPNPNGSRTFHPICIN